MKRIRLAAASALLAVAVLAPSTAMAYTPVAPGGSTFTIPPGGSATIPFSGFASLEPVTFTHTGENGAGATLAAVKSVVSTVTITKTARESGETEVTVTLPADAKGTYTLTASGSTSGKSVSVTITAATGATLPATGVDSASLMGVWIGGGVLLLGGLAVTVFAVRRQRQDA